MLLSIGIKNSILVILIILIIHFFLKNMLKSQSLAIQTPEQFEMPIKSIIEPNNDPIKFIQGPTSKNITSCLEPDRLDDIQMKKMEQDEMMQYVAMGDTDNDNDKSSLDKYFKDNNTINTIDSKLIPTDNICKMKVDNHQLPLSTTCNTNIQNMSNNNNMKIQADCELNQDKKNMMILNEYEDEKPMNGGLLYGDLNAFDSNNINYQTIV